MDQSNLESHKSYQIFLLFLLIFIDYCYARMIAQRIKFPSYSESNLEIPTLCAERLPPRGSNYYIHTNERRVV